MRLNQFLARHTELSRRGADAAISAGRVAVNTEPAQIGLDISEDDQVTLDGKKVGLTDNAYVVLNKPTGYICSKLQQGAAPTIYELLPSQHQNLKSVGRLDRDSSGLLLLTNDGELSHSLTHPSFAKAKVYLVTTKSPLSLSDIARLQEGVMLEDGVSRLGIESKGQSSHQYRITLAEGRNRQIRRSFDAVNAQVTKLHRVSFGKLYLGTLAIGAFKEVRMEEIL